jgi:hypothetical protein
MGRRPVTIRRIEGVEMVVTAAQKTLYEVLGVSRNAKANEIGLAYQRLRAAMQDETSAPDARRAAMAKMAYETLSDAERRAEYDATLEDDALPVAMRKRQMRMVAIAVLLVVAAGIAGYWFLVRAPQSDRDALAPRQVVEAVASHVARVEGALVSGEVRDLGMAVDVADNEMIVPCAGLAAGMALNVKQDKFQAQAEVTRSNPDVGICTLGVKAARAGIRMRTDVPGAQEPLQAVLVGAGGAIEARPVTVRRAAQEGKGALEVRSPATLPPGTPIFDAQARLVGIVAPPSASAGAPTAWDATRIAQARATPG